MNDPIQNVAHRTGRERVLIPALAASVLGVVLAHIVALKNGFVDFDDNTIFLNNPLLKRTDSAAFWEILSPDRANWRPLRDLSHWFDFLAHGQTAVWSHAHNLLLLGCCVWLCGKLLMALGASQRAAAWAAFLGFAHPVQVETISWVSGRKDLLACICGFGAMLAFYRMLKSNRCIAWGLAGVVLTGLGIMAKGHIIVMPVLFFWLVLLERQRSDRPLSARVWVTGTILCVLAVVALDLVARGGVLLGNQFAADDLQHRLTLGDRIQLPLRYLINLLWPVDLNHIYLTQQLGVSHTIMTSASALVTLALFVRLYTWLRRRDTRGPVLALAMTLMAPYLHFKAGTVYMADRYLFMVVPILCWLAYDALANFSLPRRVQNGLLMVVGMTWVMTGLQHHQAWQNPVNLWARMAEVYPESAWGYQRLGRALYFRGEVATAAEAWLTAINRNSQDTQSMNNAAVALMELGRLQHARQLLERCLTIDPEDQQARRNLAKLGGAKPTPAVAP